VSRRASVPAGLFAGIVVATLLGASVVRADGAITARRISQLYHAYYGMGVIDYCGLDSWEVNDGYERRIRYLLETADLDTESVRRIRIKGWIEADYQFGNHGLGGFRGWCAHDGRRAQTEFLAFRAGELGSTRN
jgi:hypothetical protein